MQGQKTHMHHANDTTDFWNRHSLEFLEMACDTTYQETLENPDGRGTRTGECGDTVTFYIQVEDGRLAHISFAVQGCMNTTACCNTVVHLARSKSLEDAWDITPDRVCTFLKTLPPDHVHCSELAVGGFYLALADYQAREATGR